MNLRTRLRALILVTLLPAAILGTAGAYILVEKERETLEQDVNHRTLALINAIESEIQASIASLEGLARSDSLRKHDLQGFRAEAERALAARKGTWENIVLTDAKSHEMLDNLVLPPGTTLPTQDVESVIAAVRSRRGALGNVATGGALDRPIFPIRVSVQHGEQTPYVIAAMVDLGTIGAIVDRQRIPGTWAVAVMDGNYRFVARRPAPPQGQDYASASLRAAVERSEPGWQRGRLLDGTEIYRFVHRFSVSRWSASVAVPQSVVDEGLRGLWLLIAGLAGAAVLGLWIAWWLASRIAGPIAALAAAAPAVARGEPSAIPPPGPIDEVRQLSQALGEAALAIRQREEHQKNAEQALRAADRAKDEFLAMLGHELRNPLSSVSNAAQLLKHTRPEPAVLQNVSAILSRQVEQMTRIVDDLLEVGRVTGGHVRLERAPLDLARVAAELVETWTSASRFLHHDLRTDLQPAWAMADRARAEQIVSNLLDNALKYTPAGGRIDLSVRRDGHNALLEVRDTGEGLASDLKDRVFDLFVQGKRNLARERGGLGIGLTMVRRLVELHDGRIEAESKGPGEGARFRVTLPAIEKPATTPDVKAPPEPAGAARVLIVEDNADARESLATLLRSAGHAVHAAVNGAEGLELAAAHPFEAAIIDIGLPDIDGYEVARRLRHSPATRDLQLIALTGYGMQEDRRRALAAGFDEHLAKPADLETLSALLRAGRSGRRALG